MRKDPATLKQLSSVIIPQIFLRVAYGHLLK